MKYQSDGGPSPAQIAALLRSAGQQGFGRGRPLGISRLAGVQLADCRYRCSRQELRLVALGNQYALGPPLRLGLLLAL